MNSVAERQTASFGGSHDNNKQHSNQYNQYNFAADADHEVENKSDNEDEDDDAPLEYRNEFKFKNGAVYKG